MALDEAREITVCDAVVDDINTQLSASSGLGFVAARVWSFGFTDAELSTLRVVARPYDTQDDTAERADEQADYELQIGIFKMVPRKDVDNIDKYFNLVKAIFGLYPIDRQFVVGTDKLLVTAKRFFPLMFRSTTIMDTTDPNTRMQSSFLVTFREWQATTA